MELLPPLLLLAIAGAWMSRGRYQKGSVARKVSTAIAVLLSLIGLSLVGFVILFMIAFASWGNNK